MKLATSDMIPKIDEFAEQTLGLPTRTLMERAGEAVAHAVLSLSESDSPRVVIFAGKGNNGGDGYAAAVKLADRAQVTVYDVFSAGQRSDAGIFWRESALGMNIPVIPLTDISVALDGADIAVDAVFGTGFSGEYPTVVRSLAEEINSRGVRCVAVDVPIGVDADSGECTDFALRADVTVALSYPKVGTLSYPARDYCGEIVTDTLGIDTAAVESHFDFKNILTDDNIARTLLPRREKNSHKGSYGRLNMHVGCDAFRGAAHLALEAALRSGVGYVTFFGTDALCTELRMKMPEAVYKAGEIPTDASVTLVGSGSGCTRELAELVTSLAETDGAPMILDADAINAIATYSSAEMLKSSKRKIILTPHPLELSRLCGVGVSDIQSHRLSVARSFARDHGCVLILKGAATVITDGEMTFVNSSGSSALAKAGSGDVLAGLVSSLIAQNPSDPLGMSALGAYLHGRAGDSLSERLTDYGVAPSDLPLEVAHIIKELIGK